MTCPLDHPSHAQSCRHTPCAVGCGTKSLTAIAIIAALVIASVVADTLPLRAHDGPEHVIETITETIERSGPTSNLLFDRAIEYRAMRDYRNAEKDLRSAIALDDKNRFMAECELAGILLRVGGSEAESDAQRLVAAMWNRYHAESTPEIKCELTALAAELHYQNKHWDFAAECYGQALEIRDDALWFVLRSRAQARSDNIITRESRVPALRKGWKKTQSPVIRQELCDALLDATIHDGNYGARGEASALIEEELRLNRYRSAWLLRRAMLLRHEGDKKPAESDLREALAELETRLHSERPDVELLIRRGRCFAMLGDIAQARADLRRAELRHAPDWMLEPLVEALGDRTSPTVVSPDDSEAGVEP